MERYCSTCQSPQQAVAPTEEEEDQVSVGVAHRGITFCCRKYTIIARDGAEGPYLQRKCYVCYDNYHSIG
jgi:hypothetical protein